MAPYEALYGRKCRTPLCWYQDGEAVLIGPELLEQTTEQVRMVRDRIQASQSRLKAYADRRRRPLEFTVGDHVFLRVTRTIGVGRPFRSRKLSPKFLALIRSRGGLVWWLMRLHCLPSWQISIRFFTCHS